MPAYNEQDVLYDVINAWYPYISNCNSKSRLVVADSGSSDKTHDILLEFKKDHPKLEILSNTKKEHGSKLVYLYKYAIKQGADFVFQTDSDGQTVALEFKDFWDDRNKYDAILGNRKHRGDGAFRTLVEKTCCKFIKHYFHFKTYDSNVPFRLMKCEVLQKFINKIPADHNLPNILVTVYLGLNNNSICYKNISFLKRDTGKSMYDLKRIWNYGSSILRDFKAIKKRTK